jgi:hypothetical protein
VFAYQFDRLQPTAVVFLSHLAWKKFRPPQPLSVPHTWTPHPGCRWWNAPAKTYGDRAGKDILDAFVREHLRWPPQPSGAAPTDAPST